MRSSDSRKLARLRSGESAPEEVAGPAGEPADYRKLRELGELDERLRAEGYEALLDEREGAIIDEALRQHGINYYRIGAALGLSRSIVWRRVKRLLKRAGYLQEFAEMLLGEIAPAGPEKARETWPIFKAKIKAEAYHTSSKSTVHYDVLSLDDLRRLNSMLQGRAAARRMLNPPEPPSLRLEWRGEKMVITCRGPLPEDLREAVRAGKAERIFDGPPRCHACGRYVSRSPTGRPPKYCSERCRSRYRRRC